MKKASMNELIQNNISEDSLNSLGVTTKSILDILHLDSILDTKDEEDRKGIALWGFEDKYR